MFCRFSLCFVIFVEVGGGRRYLQLNQTLILLKYSVTQMIQKTCKNDTQRDRWIDGQIDPHIQMRGSFKKTPEGPEQHPAKPDIFLNTYLEKAYLLTKIDLSNSYKRPTC